MNIFLHSLAIKPWVAWHSYFLLKSKDFVGDLHAVGWGVGLQAFLSRIKAPGVIKNIIIQIPS